MKILLVEDDHDQSDLIRDALEMRFGEKSVQCAYCGREAMRMSLAEFDIILTDFNLPDISGVDLLAALVRLCDAPIIVVTGENVLETATLAIRTGASDYLVKAGDYVGTIPLAVEKNIASYKIRQENKRLHQEQARFASEIAAKNQQLKESLLQMERMAATDPLTGLFNRRHFNTFLQRSFEETTRYGQDLSCVMADLDNYKKLNDLLGHQFGDKILQVTAKVISLNLRLVDFAARYGGDEFVLLLPHAGVSTATQVAARIQAELLEQFRTLVPHPHSLSMSLGISSVYANRPTHAEQLVAFADDALYQAKRAGKNRIMAMHSRPAAAEAPDAQATALRR